MIEKNLTKEAIDIMQQATQIAKKYNQNFVTLYHVIYSMLDNVEIEHNLDNMFNIDVVTLKATINEEIKSLKSLSEVKDTEIEMSTLVQDFMVYVIKVTEENLNKNKDVIDIINVNQYNLFSNFLYFIKDMAHSNVDNQLYNLIKDSTEVDEDYEDIIDRFRKLDIQEVSNDNSSSLSRNKKILTVRDLKKNKGDMKEFLEENISELEEDDDDAFALQYLSNMNELYLKGNLNKEFYGREEEISEIIRVLSRKEKSNPLLVGDSGVGKTALVHLLIKKICEKDVPEKMQSKKIFLLDIDKVNAGSKYRGDIEKRVLAVVDYIKKDKDNILFIENLHNAIKENQQGSDVSSILAGSLSSKEISCISTSLFTDYNKLIKKDKLLSTKLQKIYVNEPSKEETLEMLKLGLNKYQEHHDVFYTDKLLENIIYLADRYLHTSKFPDKAFDVIDEIGSLYSSGLRTLNENKEANMNDALEIISKKAKINILTKEEELAKLYDIEEKLKSKIFGQDKTVEELCNILYIAESDLNDPNKPFASMIFTGPTGVGKTEILKEISRVLNRPLLRFDMSEYSEKHSVSNLIGSQPGYIGYGEGGKLTNAVMNEPYSILLLDEIEKADKSVYNLLLQVFDNGFLTDTLGNKVSFRNTIIVLTSNAGVFERSKNNIGFFDVTIKENDTDVDKKNKEMLKNYFSPEFINRLTGVVEFNYLNEDNIKNVASKNINIIRERLESKNITLVLEPAVEAWLANKGYDKEMGARPMEKVIQKYITQPISKKLILNKKENKKEFNTVKINILNEQLDYSFD